MVKIRLKRVGKRKQPTYRVVVADARSPRDGRNIELLGHYDPRRNPSGIAIDNERAVFWLRQGARPSHTVRNLLRISGAWSQFTGEAPSPGPAAPAPGSAASAAAKPTPAASVTVARGDEEPEGAETPEAADERAAAPEAGEEA
jgi:small subunit ribosomal protein S16